MSEKTENITTEQQNEDAVLGVKTKIVLSKNVDFFGPGLFYLLQYIGAAYFDTWQWFNLSNT